LTIEVGKFDAQKMINPAIQGVDYQQGQTYGYHDVRYFVFARDQYTYQVCKGKGKILNTHHIVYRSHVDGIFRIKQFRKKKRSLHEATARKGRKHKNVTSKRNKKNMKQLKGFYLNDKVRLFGETGYITGFTGTNGAYVKTMDGDYITIPGKNYKRVSLKGINLIEHNNNWQFEQSAFG